VSPLQKIVRAIVINTHLENTLSPHCNKFFIQSYDLQVTKLGKLRILRSILNADNHQALLKEFIVRASFITGQFLAQELSTTQRTRTIVWSNPQFVQSDTVLGLSQNALNRPLTQ
jgi:hypothetical protein